MRPKPLVDYYNIKYIYIWNLAHTLIFSVLATFFTWISENCRTIVDFIKHLQKEKGLQYNEVKTMKRMFTGGGIDKTTASRKTFSKALVEQSLIC